MQPWISQQTDNTLGRIEADSGWKVEYYKPHREELTQAIEKIQGGYGSMDINMGVSLRRQAMPDARKATGNEPKHVRS